MTNNVIIGDAVTVDYAIDNGMKDDDEEIIIYRSAEGGDDETHEIRLTVWRKEDEVAHNFSYVVDEDDSVTTQESALDPDDLIDELPEIYRKDARDAVTKWTEANELPAMEPGL